ncbi:hypothetical protein HK104_000416 [Borealophlyctis nickersoniae]|nr:hypothetical protein HK104_000416 [Borealophlyctis nickersoniae]
MNDDQDPTYRLWVRGLPTDPRLQATIVQGFFEKIAGPVSFVRLKTKWEQGQNGETGEDDEARAELTGFAEVELFFLQSGLPLAMLLTASHGAEVEFNWNARRKIYVRKDRPGRPQNRVVTRQVPQRVVESGISGFGSTGGQTADHLIPAKIQMGQFIGELKFLEQWVDEGPGLKLQFDYALNQAVYVFFQVKNHTYKLEYRFKKYSIRDTFKIERRIQDGIVEYHLTSSLSLPPLLFYKTASRLTFGKWSRVAFAHLGDKPLNSFFDTDDGNAEVIRDIIANAPNTARYLDIRYQFTFLRPPGSANPVDAGEKRLLRCFARLSEYGLISNTRAFVELQVVRQSDIPAPYDILKSKLPYSVIYKIFGLISHNVISEFNIDEDFIEFLRKLPPEVVEGVLEGILDAQEGVKVRIWNPTEVIGKRLDERAAPIQDKVSTKTPEPSLRRKPLMENFLQIFKQKETNHNQTKVRKLIITPTKIYYEGPQLELSNRIIRNYKEQCHRFLRVTFCDDDLGPIRSGAYSNLLYKRIQAVLADGIHIADIEYAFLHYSNSQLRGSGCWFFAEDRNVSPSDANAVTCDRIRRTMGNFSNINNPATLGARMGQCFSSTTVAGRCSEEQIKNVPDVVASTGGEFSDGVGRIGAITAKRVTTYLRRFHSSHIALEIVRTSFYSPGYLNHQYIILLESLGIPASTFHAFKDEMLAGLNALESSAEEAIRVLNENADEFGVSKMLVDMIHCGFYDIKEPYLFNLLRLFRAIQLKDIKKRARLHVPKSCTLIGVMDETGLLPANTIFLQYKCPITDEKIVITGNLVITRAPALHPGDIQVVYGVDVPELRHLFDVVVFPQKGERPLPNMLAGGDLDGDTFFVSWDARLIPFRTAEPMEYTTGKGMTLDQTLGVDDVRKHFVNYMRNNNLGKIDNAWKATADRSPKGAFAQTALKLAALHSDAVDFPKKGIPAVLDKNLIPREYPDFMEKPHKPSYKSTKAIGEIYRSVEVSLQLIKDFKPDERLFVPGFEDFVDDARRTKMAYDLELCSLMRQYGIKSEFELVSGYLFKLDEGIKKRPQELKEQVMQAVSVLKQHYRSLFWTQGLADDPAVAPYKQEGSVGEAPLPDVIKRKAYAWYLVTYQAASTPPPSPKISGTRVDGLNEQGGEEAAAAERRRLYVSEHPEAEYEGVDLDLEGRLVSFCWTIHDVLGNILLATRKAQEGAAAA